MISYNDSIFNPALTSMARGFIERGYGLRKTAFVPGGDPSMGADPSGGGGAPPPMDPSMGGGAPPSPMDPSGGGGAPPPMDPSMGGGAPPPPPPGGGGGGGGGDIGMMIQTAVQTALQASGMSQSGGNQAGGIKPKIDVNVTMLQILKILARIADTLGIKIPASEMVATSGDLTQFAQQQQQTGQQDASGGAGGAGGGGMGAIPPIPPMEAAGPMPKQGAYAGNGRAYDGSSIDRMIQKASATSIILNRRQQHPVNAI